MQVNSKIDEKTFQIFYEGGKTKQFVGHAKISQPQIHFAKISQTKNHLAKNSQGLQKIRKPALPCENIVKFERGCELSSQLKNPFCNLANSNSLRAKYQWSAGKPNVI